MIESRACASVTEYCGRTISWIAQASGPRWAMRSIIVLARILPSGCWKVPAIPHMRSAPRSRGRLHQVLEDLDVGTVLVLPCELVDDPLATDPAHCRAQLRVIQQADDASGEEADVVGLDVQRRVAGRHSRLAEVERDDR